MQEGMCTLWSVGHNKINNSEWSEEYYILHNHTSEATWASILQKINYMIHLLEEQQDIKHGSTTEELVLYCFLGVLLFI